MLFAKTAILAILGFGAMVMAAPVEGVDAVAPVAVVSAAPAYDEYVVHIQHRLLYEV
jgi:hypothetical protein